MQLIPLVLNITSFNSSLGLTLLVKKLTMRILWHDIGPKHIFVLLYCLK